MKPHLTVAEVFRAHGKEFLDEHGPRVPAYQKTALWRLAHCKTPALGGHLLQCPNCRHEEYRFNSCRHRGCPQCEGSKEAAWLLERESELLPTHYFHVVFTVPHHFNELFLHNQKSCFSILFQAVAETLQTVGRDRLGAKLGFFSILHTWGQRLEFHPHIHVVVPGGGLKDDGTWIRTSKKRRYFAPTKVLALVFRGILIKKLKRAHKKGELSYAGNFKELLDRAVARKWVVHAKPPFGSALSVLKYLSRYTRKVAIGNSRLLSLDRAGNLSFSYRDYREAPEKAKKICRIKALEFIRRFLIHIPPSGFVRIRHYGFMAGKGRKERLERIRALIIGLLPIFMVTHEQSDGSFRPQCCPHCKAQMVVSVIIKRATAPERRDSS